jgi:hypothetical protein
VLGAFAGVAVLSVGTTAVALAATHSSPAVGTGSVCQTLPAGASSPPGSPTSTVSPGINATVSTSSSPTQLCINVQAVAGTVQAGQNADYKISVWPLYGPVNAVTVQVSVTPRDSSPAFPRPVFFVCGKGDGTQTCSVGPLTTGQTAELEAEVAVPKPAPSGDSATLTATAIGAASGATSTGSVSGLASVNVTAAPTPTPTPTPTRHSGGGGHSGSHSSGSGSSAGSGFPSSSLGASLPLGDVSLAGGSTAGNPAGLFPTINPSSGSGQSGTTQGKHGHTGPYRARTVADVLPLTGGLVGSQIAGLVVLAVGITLAVARVSLRKPRSSPGK